MNDDYEIENPIPKEEQLGSRISVKKEKKSKKVVKTGKKTVQIKKVVEKVEMKEEKAKRVRRGFSKIILDKVDAKSGKIDKGKYILFRSKLEILMTEFEKLLVDAKATAKAEKNKFKKLQKFTKEELQEYLKSL